MGNLGVPELLIILLLLLVFFGAKKIPEMAQGLGKGIREFRKATKEVQEDIDSDTDKKFQSPRRIEAGEQSDRSKGEQLVCYFCKAEITASARFCPSCGKSLEPPKCAQCNTVNPLGGKFCKECGAKL